MLSSILIELLGIPENYAEHGGSVDHLIEVVHWFMLALFVGWTGFFFYCCFRFCKRKNPKASYHGVKNHVTTHLEIGVAIFEAVLLLGFAFPLWSERTDRFETIQAQDPVRVRVIGYQFSWKYHYPGNDGKFGRIDRHLAKNLGDACIDPDDPNGWDDFVSGELNIPVNKPAILQVTATDVIHAYAIVPMRIQQDAIPGVDIPMWFRPLKVLETNVVCAQLCGEGHGSMVGLMFVKEQEEYYKWAAEQSSKAKAANSPKDPAPETPEPEGEGEGEEVAAIREETNSVPSN